jgi:hypothetical protein
VDEKIEEQLWNFNERRVHPRKKIDLQRTFAAEIIIDSVQKTYLYVVDISHGGMKIMTDILFPQDREVKLMLICDEPLEVSMDLVWHRKMLGDMYIMGLKFTDLSPVIDGSIDNFISKYSGVAREEIRLNEMFILGIFQSMEWKKYPIYALSLSLEGLTFTTDKSLPINEELFIQFALGKEETTFETYARVQHLDAISDGRFKGFLKFERMSEQDSLRLGEQINTMLLGELPTIIVPPIKDFEVP